MYPIFSCTAHEIRSIIRDLLQVPRSQEEKEEKDLTYSTTPGKKTLIRASTRATASHMSFPRERGAAGEKRPYIIPSKAHPLPSMRVVPCQRWL